MPVFSSLSQLQTLGAFILLTSTLVPGAHWSCKIGLIIKHCSKAVDIWQLDAYFPGEVALAIQITQITSAVLAFLALLLLTAARTKNANFHVAGAWTNLAAFLVSVVPWALFFAYLDADKHGRGVALWRSVLGSIFLFAATGLGLFGKRAAALREKELDTGLLLEQQQSTVKEETVGDRFPQLIAQSYLGEIGLIAALLSLAHLYSTNDANSGLEAKTLLTAAALFSFDIAVLLRVLIQDQRRGRKAKMNAKLIETLVFAIALLNVAVGIPAIIFAYRAKGDFELSSITALLSTLAEAAVAGLSGYLAFA